ncbi:tetratricopeptide repeat protein [Magnetococcales bacterium HHB-1]
MASITTETQEHDPQVKNAPLPPPYAAQLNDALALFQQGNGERALLLCKQLVEKYPKAVEVLHAMGLFCHSLKHYEEAIRYLSQALLIEPDDLVIHFSLGSALMDHSHYSAAETRFQHVVDHQPNHLEALIFLAKTLFKQDKIDKSIEYALQAVELSPEAASAHLLLSSAFHTREQTKLLANFHWQRYLHYNQNREQQQEHDKDEVAHTLFFNPQTALETAKKKQRVRQNIAINAPQLCFYIGAPFEEAPDSLIALSVQDLHTFFTTTRYHLPTAIQFDNNDPVQVTHANQICRFIASVLVKRLNQIDDIVLTKQRQKPIFDPNKPLRVFLSSSRETTVMQYCSRDIADAFRRLGCEVYFFIEQNEKERLWLDHKLQQMINFNPHAVININHVHNAWLHEDVVNIIWFQDSMSNLIEGKTYSWRERDILFSVSPEIDRLLQHNCKAPKPQRQPFAIDHHIFKKYPEVVRQNKAIFVGTSYIPDIKQHLSSIKRAIKYLEKAMEQGEMIDETLATKLSYSYQLPYRAIWPALCNYVLRKETVRWLCENPTHPVEVYGRFWHLHPEIKPYFKGEIAHGKALAKLYNQTRYALSTITIAIGSQRLAELAACGAIPLVYDCREGAEEPHWNDECLFFKTREDLHNILGKEPKNSPELIAQAYDYDVMAQKLYQQIIAIFQGAQA